MFPTDGARARSSKDTAEAGTQRLRPANPAANSSAPMSPATSPEAVKPHSFVRDVLGGEQLVAVDVGARYDIPEVWLVLEGHMRVVAFEPDPKACEELRAVYDARGHGHLYRNLPIAVSGTGGKRTLYVTNTPSGSSLLSPDTAHNRAYVDNDYIFPIKERTVETRTLRDVLDEIGEPRVDMVKIDVEGAALEIVESLGEERLKNVLSIELETSTKPQFKGERAFFEINTFMEKHGFELMDLRRLYTRMTRNGRPDGYQREVFGVHAESPTISPRMMGVDAFYFRSPEEILARGPGEVRRLAAVFATYGYFCEAYNLLERADAMLGAKQAEAARNALVEWHALPTVRRLFHSPTAFWNLARQATKMVGMSDQVMDAVARKPRDVVRKIAIRAREAFTQSGDK